MISPLLIQIFSYVFLALQLGTALILFRKDRFWSAMMLVGPCINIVLDVLVWKGGMGLRYLDVLSFLGYMATLSFFTGLLFHALSYREEQSRNSKRAQEQEVREGE